MAKVGIIEVSLNDTELGLRLMHELQHWLQNSGWNEVVTASLRPAREGAFVDFVPGKYQSNGPKRIWLQSAAQFSDFENVLSHWLWELE